MNFKKKQIPALSTLIVALLIMVLAAACEPRQDPAPEPVDTITSPPPVVRDRDNHILLEPMDSSTELEDVMQSVAKRMEAGDMTLLDDVYVPFQELPPVPDSLVASDVFGLPENDLSGSVLESCGSFPYLVETSGGDVVFRNNRPLYNSFSWWDKEGDIPASGPITEQFECEFNQPIATIVGANTGRLTTAGYRYVTDWGSVSAQSPNSMPGVRFTVRRHGFTADGPVSNPVFVNRNVVTENNRESLRVLINSGYPRGRGDPDTTTTRPSLFIDFEQPQRAVGLEFGYDQIPSLRTGEPHTDDIKLIAYDKSGQSIAVGNGAALESTARTINAQRNRVRVNNVTHRVGVRDRRARIHSVELRFGEFDPDSDVDLGMIVEPQIVYRIWHEPLPHAAVLQTPMTTQLSASDIQPDTHIVELPYNFDRAVVFLRGFKGSFDDDVQRDIASIRATLLHTMPEPGTLTNFGIPSVTTIYRVDPGGTIEVNPIGGLSSGEILNRTVTLYTSVLAWDSTQTSIYTRSGAASASTFDGDNVLSEQATMQDSQCPTPASGSCGDLFPALQAFGVSVASPWNAGEVEHFWAAVGHQAGRPGQHGWRVSGGGFASIAQHAYTPQLLHRTPGPSMIWDFSTGFEGGETSDHGAGMAGTVITGPSVSTSVLPAFAFTGRRMGRRPNAQTFSLPAEFIRDNSMMGAVSGDVGFLGIETFVFLPDGRLADVEFELRGEVYDGAVLDWQFGGGMDSSGRDDGSGHMMAFPLFGSVIRNDSFARPRLEVQDVVVDAVIGLSNASDGIGILRNVGSDSVVIDEIYQVRVLDSDTQFEPRLLWDGGYRNMEQMQPYLPLRLEPGQQILLGTIFSPLPRAQIRTFGQLGRYASRVGFSTNSKTQPSVGVPLRGFAIEPDPGCRLTPQELDFGSGPGASQPQTLHAALLSTGSTPLVVQQPLRLQHGTRGFSNPRFAARQIEPDVRLILVDWAGSSGPLLNLVTDTLIVDTNAGPCEMELKAGGVRQAPMGGP